MTLRAGDARMFGVIKFAVSQPTLNDHGLGNFGFALVPGLDLMTISATGIQRGGRPAHGADLHFRPDRRGAEKYAPLKVLSRGHARLQTLQLFLGELIQARGGRQTGARGEIHILFWQTAEKCAYKVGIAVRQSQAGRFGIELQRVTDLTVRLKVYAPEMASGRVRLVAGAAIEFLAIGQYGNCFAGEVQGVVELEGIRIAPLVRVDAKLRMILREAVDDLRRPARALGGGSGHGRGITVTESAVRIGGCGNRSDTLMFCVTERTRNVPHHVGLMD